MICNDYIGSDCEFDSDSDSNVLPPTKKPKTRHVIKFRDYEIDENDFHVLNSIPMMDVSERIKIRVRHQVVFVDTSPYKRREFERDCKHYRETGGTLRHSRSLSIFRIADSPMGKKRLVDFTCGDALPPLLPKSPKIFDWIVKFDALEELDLYRYRVKRIPTKLSRLTFLKKIRVNARHLEHFPKFLFQMPSLLSINIDECDDSKWEYPYEEEDPWDIDDNELPEKFEEVLKLRCLHGPVQCARSDVFASMDNLKELQLQGSYDGRLTSSLLSLVNLEALDVTFSALVMFPPKFFEKCIKIKTLRLCWDGEWLQEKFPKMKIFWELLRTVGRMKLLERLEIYRQDTQEIDEAIMGDKYYKDRGGKIPPICVLNGLPSLRELRFTRIKIIVPHLNDFSQITSLKFVGCCMTHDVGHLETNDEVDDETTEETVIRLPSLESFSICNGCCQLDLERLCMPNLQEMNLEFRFMEFPNSNRYLDLPERMTRDNEKHVVVPIDLMAASSHLKRLRLKDDGWCDLIQYVVSLNDLSALKDLERVELDSITVLQDMKGHHATAPVTFPKMAELKIHGNTYFGDRPFGGHTLNFGLLHMPLLEVLKTSLTFYNVDNDAFRKYNIVDEILKKILAQSCPNLVELRLLRGLRSCICNDVPDDVIRRLPPGLKIFNLCCNCHRTEKNLLKIVEHCPELGALGQIPDLDDERSPEQEANSQKLLRVMSLNRAWSRRILSLDRVQPRSDGLSTLAISKALWPKVLANACLAFSPYKSSDNTTLNANFRGYNSFKEPDAIFILLRERAVLELFPRDGEA